VLKGSSREFEAGAVDWKRRDGDCGCMRLAQKMQGAVVCRVRNGEMEDCEVVGERSRRAAVERIERMAVDGVRGVYLGLSEV